MVAPRIEGHRISGSGSGLLFFVAACIAGCQHAAAPAPAPQIGIDGALRARIEENLAQRLRAGGAPDMHGRMKTFYFFAADGTASAADDSARWAVVLGLPGPEVNALARLRQVGLNAPLAAELASASSGDGAPTTLVQWIPGVVLDIDGEAAGTAADVVQAWAAEKLAPAIARLPAGDDGADMLARAVADLDTLAAARLTLAELNIVWSSDDGGVYVIDPHLGDDGQPLAARAAVFGAIKEVMRKALAGRQ